MYALQIITNVAWWFGVILVADWALKSLAGA